VSDNALTAVKTEGKMWFAVETKEALAFAVADGLKQIGTISEDENWLGDGAFDPDGNRIAISLSGKGKQIQAGGSSWSEFTVERWRSAVYINLSYFGDLYTDTINFITDIAKHIKLRGQRTTLIEVGCGTGEFIRPIADHFRLSIGMDFNKNFIEFCNENIPKGKEEKMHYYEGDACELVQLMKDKAPKHIWNDTKIVCCIGNTIGIIPENMKPRVYQQMAELAGPEGVVVMVYWNSRCFGDACQNFYFANPQLCGPFTGDSIDFSTTTLKTPAPWNYRSHWTGIDEARQMLRKYNLEEIVVEERGKGVLAAARVNTKTD
jgi:SAM-dependent methyltransferase